MSEVSASAFVKALRAEGLTVKQFRKNWQNHNRNSVKRPNRHGVAVHHTADDSSRIDQTCWTGRSDLPGPLCESVLHKDGLVVMVGYGRTNNFGMGDSHTFAVMTTEKGTLPAKPDLSDDIDFNSAVHAVEIVNLGNGKDPYPLKQQEAIVKWVTAACRVHGWSEKSVIGHKEGTRRKIDPSFDMAQLRRRVKEALALPAGEWKLITHPDPPPDPKPPVVDPKKKAFESLDAADQAIRNARTWVTRIQ